MQFHQISDQPNIDIPHLNRLMKDPRFWGIFGDAEYLLTFQTDALLIHGNIAPFLPYSFIGAPWHLQNERWSSLVAKMPHGVGNGGLSLRSLPAMRELSAEFGPRSPDTEHEDFFFAQLIEKDSMAAAGPGKAPGKYSLPSRATAYQFAVEVPCVDLEAPHWDQRPLQTLPHVPFALHATWYYFIDDPRRMHDLRTLLEFSVCGYGAAAE